MNYIINLNEKILAVYSTKKNACIYILNYYIEKLNDSKTKKIENITITSIIENSNLIIDSFEIEIKEINKNKFVNEFKDEFSNKFTDINKLLNIKPQKKKKITEKEKKLLEKIRELEIIKFNKKKQLDRKKEKENEIARRFDTDYNIYLKIKDNNDIPILFEVQFNIFKNMENDNILNDIKKSFQIYKENFNKIKENVGSSKYSSLFNKNEYEAI